jgi:toxin YoeB
MGIHWNKKAWDDYIAWQTSDRRIAKKINALVKAIYRQERVGKAELLKGALAGYASARINSEHRLVYKLSKDGAETVLEILQCKNHYGN